MKNRMKTEIEKRKTSFLKKGVPIALALSLLMPVLTACDETEETDTGKNTGSPDATTEEVIGSVNVENGADFDFGPMLDQLDFTDLLTSTEGQEFLDYAYDMCLESEKNNPEEMFYDGEKGNYFRILTSDVGEKRHNVMLEIKNVDNDRWSYVLVSTKDDFAVVARDSKKHNDYIVGFMDGKVVDQAGYLDKSARSMINGMIMAEGYDATMNQVRDEFFGQLLNLYCTQDEDCALGFLGETNNVWDEDRDLNPVEERDYIMTEIRVLNKFTGEIYTTMDATYDIPDNYLGTQLGN